ncbi:hypothetical protein [Holdemania massiliensis]|uniref:hypothetical protein n=1 Tax=Holdemania massiliensis TaxID=1468449 RepID=UPI0002FC5502|nr:hypothetical protein [Holdemania massiliensis]
MSVPFIVFSNDLFTKESDFIPYDEFYIAQHDTAALLPLILFPDQLDFMSAGDNCPPLLKPAFDDFSLRLQRWGILASFVKEKLSLFG